MKLAAPAGFDWHLRQVGAPAAWRYARGRGVVIAVVDVFVDASHEEFAGRVVAARDGGPGPGDQRPRGWEPHGTQCAGVACAAGIGISGVAPEASLLPVRLALPDHGLDSPAEARAIRWAARQGADVILCCWGPARLGRRPHRLPPVTRRAIDWALETGRRGKGCVMVWSGGNDGVNLGLNGYASHPGVIVVGACNDRGKRSRYSNWGETLWCVFPSSDPEDPGAEHRAIWTTAPTGSLLEGETYYTDRFGYTSAAAAGIAGLAALILSANPDLTWQEVKEVLRRSCVKVDRKGGAYDAQGHSRYYGYGRPNAARAVRLSAERRKPRHPSV